VKVDYERDRPFDCLVEGLESEHRRCGQAGPGLPGTATICGEGPAQVRYRPAIDIERIDSSPERLKDIVSPKVSTPPKVRALSQDHPAG
jgi:hypothetical protein